MEDAPEGAGSSGTTEASGSPKGSTGMTLDRASLEAIIEGVSQRLAASKETNNWTLGEKEKAKMPPPSSGREVLEQSVTLNPSQLPNSIFGM